MIVSADKSAVKAMATLPRANLKSFQFVADAGARTTYWQVERSRIEMRYTLQRSDPIVRLNYDSITLIPGQYSKLITLG